jgi:hypothetical protein
LIASNVKRYLQKYEALTSYFDLVEP